jgi:alkanesulfonate monooxygenase SsuD/methylene tetrahydromethanopterin reductase-like flavin-dependent oxidoreductase (luciferase family)
MEFGVFSNGFRPHTTAQQTYEEDLFEIVLADQLGFRDAYISEHHGEPVYIDKVDTLPVPELLMCKAAGLTKQIRMGAAVKLIHLAHPVDVAIQAAVTDHVVGNGRFIFGFGTGFPQPLFSQERGLPYEDRSARLRESLDFILKCWSNETPFDWDGKYWHAKNVVATPRPLNAPHMPMATATQSDDMIAIAAQRGYTFLSAPLQSGASLKPSWDKYARAAHKAGEQSPLKNITAARLVYIANSRREGIEDLRPSVTFEIGFQIKRGLMGMLKPMLNLPAGKDDVTFDDLLEAGVYIVGDADTVTERLKEFYDSSGGFGTLLITTGKEWATREKRTRSIKLFMEQVAPQLRHLEPTRVPDAAVA